MRAISQAVLFTYLLFTRPVVIRVRLLFGGLQKPVEIFGKKISHRRRNGNFRPNLKFSEVEKVYDHKKQKIKQNEGGLG
jgi:hypothetical protein